MTINSQQWSIFQNAIDQIKSPPKWLVELRDWPHEKILTLPAYDGTGDQNNSMPYVDFYIQKKDYIDHLATQVSMDSCDTRWSQTLKKRLDNLRPEIGKPILRGTFSSRSEYATIYLSLPTFRIICTEF